MKIGLVQYNPVWENKIENMKIIDSMMDNDFKNVDLLIFPEMTLTGFTMKAEKFCEDLHGESVNYFSELAQKFRTKILVGFILKEGDEFYNVLAYINEKAEIESIYKKTHPFSYSSENKHYKRGEEAVATKIGHWSTGLAVCYDLRFPELYRNYAKLKSELVVTIANWPDTRTEHWKILLRARAIENQCYSVGVNRVGDDPKLHYNGYSSVYDPMGNEIVSVKDREEIIYCDLEKEIVKETREKLPFLNDMHMI